MPMRASASNTRLGRDSRPDARAKYERRIAGLEKYDGEEPVEGKIVEPSTSATPVMVVPS